MNRIFISTALGIALSATVAAAPANAACFCSVGPDLGSTLTAGDTLHSGQFLQSPSGQYKLYMQSDGNLVEYNAAGTALWDPPPPTQTGGHTGDWAILQSDGNFVVYPASGSALWASYTQNNPGDHLVLQDDGNLVIYSASGAPLWATMTGAAAAQGTSRSQNLFPSGQCTYYAEQEAAQYNGHFPNIWGNASAWASSAAANNWSIGSTPRIGSIVVFQPWIDGAGSVGHVAFVTQVYPASHTVVFNEMNYKGLGIVDTRSIGNGFGTAGIQYIYLNP